MKKNNHVTALIILDGVGYRKETEYNAIAYAHMPHFKLWFEQYPHTILNASASAVGLPHGYTSNSEVGHITLGTGRVIKQSATIINDAIDDKSFFSNKTLISRMQKIKQANKTLHIMGLLSDAGVHSSMKHLHALLELAHQQGLTRVIVHAFLDGRDSPPQSAGLYLNQLSNMFSTLGLGTLGSICGRFYAMDRDNNWDRIEPVYELLTNHNPIRLHSWRQALDYYYNHQITDEFIPPTLLAPQSTISDGDGIIFFNFRPDRARQLTKSFIDPHFNHFNRKKLSLTCFITPVQYDPHLQTDVIFHDKNIVNTLKDVLTAAGKTIFSIAETEKYAHITYFFDGGKEEKRPSETQVLIPSLGNQSYSTAPEMSAKAITDAIVASLSKNPCDFYLVNYANADMVGHSGNFGATIKALECIDTQLGILYNIIVKQMQGTMYITADHGKAEEMYDAISKQPRTAHTNNPVPFIMLTNNEKQRTMKIPITKLSQIAPFIVHMMGLSIPAEMDSL